MVTKVLNHDGTVNHDCREIGCETSWDGVTIATGEPVEGRGEIPPDVEQIDEHTVRLPAPTDA